MPGRTDTPFGAPRAAPGPFRSWKLPVTGVGVSPAAIEAERGPAAIVEKEAQPRLSRRAVAEAGPIAAVTFRGVRRRAARGCAGLSFPGGENRPGEEGGRLRRFEPAAAYGPVGEPGFPFPERRTTAVLRPDERFGAPAIPGGRAAWGG